MNLKRTWMVFFTAVGLASFLGGTVHGFLTDESRFLYKIMWVSTLAAVGVASASAWLISGDIVSGPAHRMKWFYFSTLTLLIYLVTIFFISQNYTVVILNYAPAMFFLLVVSGYRWIQMRSQFCGLLFVGMLFTFMAAIVQQLRLGLHMEYFDHNATYHVIQGVGLVFMYRGAVLQLQAKSGPV